MILGFTKGDTLENKLSFMQCYVIKNAIDRAVKDGVLEYEVDLVNEPKKAKKVKRHERDYIDDKSLTMSSIMGTLTSIVGSCMMGIMSLKQKIVGQEFVPGVPEHTETRTVPEPYPGICYNADGDVYSCTKYRYVEKEVTVPETYDHYEPIYQTFIDKPELLSLAIVLPFAVASFFLGRRAYWDYARKTVTTKNIKKYINQNREKVMRDFQKDLIERAKS